MSISPRKFNDQKGVWLWTEVQDIWSSWLDHLNPAAFLPFAIFTILLMDLLYYHYFKSSIVWFSKEKCLATGFAILVCLMSNRWPVRQTQSAFFISPMYWMVFHLYSIKYTTLLHVVPQSVVAFVQNRMPFVVLLTQCPFLYGHMLYSMDGYMDSSPCMFFCVV